jgi:penicillin-binding protein 2
VFERRLKICLGILLSVMSILLLRAFHLQVITRASWVDLAEEFKKKATYLETTRGRILDMKGHELAVDEACMDACVDYRAITRDAAWMRSIARSRATSDADAWKKLDRKQREAAFEQVKSDIDRMFDLLAQETGQPREKIDETCRQIDLRVAMSRRIRQYRRYMAASEDHVEDAKAAWYRRWLIEGGKDGPQVDDYADTEGEEVGVHPVVRNISPDAYMRLGLALPRCPGLSLRAGSHRKYPYGRAACHLLGTVSTVTKEDIDKDPEMELDSLRAYRFNDFVGRGGIEALCEPTLRGARGRAYKRDDGSSDQIETAPAPGGDVRSTIDIDLQDQIQHMFEKMEVPNNKLEHNHEHFEVAMHGAAVVIDVKTGAVRAMASYPDYDLNTFSDDYPKLSAMTDEAPLLNRAVQPYNPGSTIKPVVGISAITQGLNVPGPGVMTTHSGIECTGYVILNGQRMPNGRCWVASKYGEQLGGKVAHHPIPLAAPHRGVYGNPDGFLCFADALERSCNVYFETLGACFGTDGLSYWFDRFGLGRETGLGIAENVGVLPRQTPGSQLAVAMFSGMGQVGVTVTPIQMANVAATIARDGIWMRPHLVEDGYKLAPIKPRDGQPIPDRVDLQLNKEALAAARDGMTRVVNSEAGTGRDAQMSEMTVAGKTGTAQVMRKYWINLLNPDGTPQRDKDGKPKLIARMPASADHPTDTPWYRGWGNEGLNVNHAWFIGFAPAERPQIAFAVLVEYGGSGGRVAGTLTRKILTACIEHGHVKL